MPTVHDWPAALCPATLDWALVVTQLGGRSVFDGSVQTQVMGVPRWACSMTTGPLRPAEVPLWEALVDKLDGMANRVRLWDMRRPNPLGVATGTPVVRVDSTGTALETEGWTASTPGILLRGSYVKVNGELKRTVADAGSDSLGRATLQIRPPLRALAAVGQPLTLVMGTAKFVLMTDRPNFRQEGSRSAGVTLAFEEDPTP